MRASPKPPSSPDIQMSRSSKSNHSSLRYFMEGRNLTHIGLGKSKLVHAELVYDERMMNSETSVSLIKIRTCEHAPSMLLRVATKKAYKSLGKLLFP